MSRVVLDASAVLALVNDEPGAAIVAAAMAADDPPSLSTVNLSEVIGRLAEWGSTEAHIAAVLAGLSYEAVDFDPKIALRAGLLRPATKSAGLSLGDRACLALGMALGAPVLTAERQWQSLGLSVQVQLIR